MSASVVTLYGRPGCHLCDEARELLAELTAGLPVIVREIDIDSDDRLLATLLERIPVIELDGVVVAELVPNRQAIAQALHTVGP